MPAQLLALNDGPSILLDKPILLLGRDLECDIRLDSRKISRRHCCIAQVGEHLVVRDLGSTNGVRINGVRVLEGQLRANDELTIGSFRYQVRFDALLQQAGDKVDKAEKRHVHQGQTDEPPDEDEILEECDEPVPLAEPGAPPRPAKALPPRPAVAEFDKAAVEGKDKPAAANKEKGVKLANQELREKGATPYPAILPDDLDLAPASDPGPSPPPE